MKLRMALAIFVIGSVLASVHAMSGLRRSSRSDVIGNSTDTTFGSLSGLSAHLSETVCDVRGLWTDQGGTKIGFVTNKSFAQLSFHGQQQSPLTFEYEENNGADAKLLSIAFGDMKDANVDDAETTPAMQVALSSIAGAQQGRLKRFSSTLARNALDGQAGTCVGRLHNLLLSLALMQDEVVDVGAVKTRQSPPEHSLTQQSFDFAPTGAGASPRRRDGRRRANDNFAAGNQPGWFGYGFGAENKGQGPVCPGKLPYGAQILNAYPGADNGIEETGVRSIDWICCNQQQLGGGCKKISDFVLPGHPSLANRGHGWDVKCMAGPTNKKCTGLCGAGCDCWEGLCGAQYKCEYNPGCCAHDMACSRRRHGSSKTCLFDAGRVNKICKFNNAYAPVGYKPAVAGPKVVAVGVPVDRPVATPVAVPEPWPIAVPVNVPEPYPVQVPVPVPVATPVVVPVSDNTKRSNSDVGYW